MKNQNKMASATQHTFYCIEDTCSENAHVFGGRCDGCFEAEITYLRELHNPTRCDYCHERINCGIDSDALYSSMHAFCGESCAEGYAVANEHTCSGEFDYDRGYCVCDDNDDLYCPSNKPTEQAKHCADCGLQRQETEPVLLCDWYCPPCWKVRFRPEKSCTDCGYTPEDGHFPCYRGNDPLCADCEEAAYGPPSPEDWRERSGHCTKCNSNFLIICSSDNRSCCGPCAAKGALPPAAEEMDEECLGCAGPCRPGANGYCSGCWQQRYGCEEE